MNTKAAILLVFSFGIIAYTFWWAYRYAMDSPYRITTDEAKRRLANQQFDLILDVRTDLEVRTLGIYPGAVHTPAANLKTFMNSQYRDKSMRILIYCNTGQRARLATEQLQNMGYRNTVYIAGSYQSLM
jgi:phage shock protein E